MPDYRITMRKHQYSASVCAKLVFQIVPKLDYIIHYFMIFPMMYSKLGHKLTNVKTASINKVLIAFVHKNYTPRTSIFTMRLCRICLRNYSQTRLYCPVFHALSRNVHYIAAQARKRQSRKD
jgi:hypothetical protein